MLPSQAAATSRFFIIWSFMGLLALAMCLFPRGVRRVFTPYVFAINHRYSSLTLALSGLIAVVVVVIVVRMTFPGLFDPIIGWLGLGYSLAIVLLGHTAFWAALTLPTPAEARHLRRPWVLQRLIIFSLIGLVVATLLAIWAAFSIVALFKLETAELNTAFESALTTAIVWLGVILFAFGVVFVTLPRLVTLLRVNAHPPSHKHHRRTRTHTHSDETP